MRNTRQIKIEDQVLNKAEDGYDHVRIYARSRNNDEYLRKFDNLFIDYGLSLKRNSLNNSLYFEGNHIPHILTDSLKKMIRSNHFPLRIVSCEQKWARGSRYRSRYFSHNLSRNGQYQCAYCGSWLPKNKIQIDHVFSIGNLTSRQTTRDLAIACGITRSDSPKNLVASCSYCNSRKDKKGGLWIIFAAFGRTRWFWPAVEFGLCGALVIAAVWAKCAGIV